MRKANLLHGDIRGGTFVEYLILVGVVALLAVAGYRAFGRRVVAKAQQQAVCVASLGDGCVGTEAAAVAPAVAAAPARSMENVSAGSAAASESQASDGPAPAPFGPGMMLLKREDATVTTIVSMDREGRLVDQRGRTYSGTFDGKAITLTRNGTNESFATVWMRGSMVSGIRGVAGLERFDFTFSDHGPTQTFNAQWTFHGTVDEARAALEKAGYEHRRLGLDFGHVEYRMPSDGRSTHFVIGNTTRDPQTGAPLTHGDVHDDACDPWHHPLGHLAEVVPPSTLVRMIIVWAPALRPPF